MDRKARHGDTRALSHRSAAEWHQADRARRRHLLRASATGRSFSSRWPRWCTDVSRHPSAIRRCTIFCSTTSPSLNKRHSGVVGTSFRTFPSFPQRFIERLAQQPPCECRSAGVTWNRCANRSSRVLHGNDLHVRAVHCSRRPGGSTARRQFAQPSWLRAAERR